MAMSASPSAATIVPAQLGFLAIYNPTLGTTDETLDDQIVYYASLNTQSQKRKKKSKRHHPSQGKPTENISQDERNERLRQIGLAQGMVEFSRGFSGGNAVDAIETEKSRVVLRELEPGWWILASIDLTKLPLPPRLGAPSAKDDASENVEYSSREVKPAALLLQDLLRAHAVFLLHHAASLSALFVRTKRHKFVSILTRYWDLFLSTWNVLLHGNPACNVLGGIKLAACGELGIGVGEEDRGSGEREVLEGFVDRTEGLVDLVVSKFGPSDAEAGADSPAKEKTARGGIVTKWLGTGDEAGAEDGAIFLGVGALSRKSLRDVTYWMEDLYSWGEDAYGVKDNPLSTRQPRKTKKHGGDVKATDPQSKGPAEESAIDNSKQPDVKVPPTQTHETEITSPTTAEDAIDEGGMTRFMQYLKLGYGTHWSLGASGAAEGVKQDDVATRDTPGKGETVNLAARRQSTVPGDSVGRFLIGLMGGAEESRPNSPADNPESGNEEQEYNSRVLVRTLTVELDSKSCRPSNELTVDLGSQENELAATKSGRKDSADPGSRFDSQDRNKTEKLRVVVYVSRPFIYTFLFRSMTDCLAWDSFYRSLHYQLAPLRKPLGTSTAYRPGRPDVGGGGSPAASTSIFDLVWDPQMLTIHSTIPSIPDPLQMALQQEGLLPPARKPPWSRIEALSTHNQILNTYIDTRSADYHMDIERTCKTSRGWWIVWTRILDREDDVAPTKDNNAATASGSTTPRAPATPKQQQLQSGSSGGDGDDADDDDDDDNNNTSSPRGRRSTSRRLSAEPSRSVSSNKGPVGSSYSSRSPRSPPLPPQSKPRIDKEIFLIRRAGEHRAAGLRALSTSYAEGGGLEIGGGGSGGGGGGAENAGRLAQGIGVDTKKYIEGLLSLTR